MPYADLRGYLAALEKEGELVRIKAEVDPNLEITEILNRLLKQGGPAVIFENVKGHRIPVVANLYGTLKRVTMGLETDEEGLREIGNFLAYLQHPDPPSGLMEAIKKVPFFAKVMSLRPKTVHSGPCQEVVMEGADVDLGLLPILKCWPEDAAPLITWPLVVTKPPDGGPYNVGVYRMQVLGKDQAILRWLSQRGGAKHYRAWMREGRPMPVAVAIGNEPATTIAAVTPLPEGISEFQFACLLRKKSIELVRCRTIDLEVPATSEIVLEGEVMPGSFASEGPYGDHTGYYNPEEPYPIFNIKSITHRKNPLYLTTVTGRPPREDAIIGIALNNIFVPMLRKNFPEVVDFHLPMEAISYRIAVVSIDKDYPGQAKRVMMGLWGFLPQFLYVKYIIVVDRDINVKAWDDVIWALATNVDPGRDVTIIENTPIDHLDFASPLAGLGSKMGIDATSKIYPEASRKWGRKIVMTREIVDKVDSRWEEYGMRR